MVSRREMIEINVVQTAYFQQDEKGASSPT
jgi:hypothetical protein